MTAADHSTMLLTLASTVLIGVASGFIPFVNAELHIFVLGAAAPRPWLPALLLLATLSHMTGKSITYLAGRRADRVPWVAMRRRVAAARTALDGRTKLGGAVIFASAVTGVPPFYAVAVASGVSGYQWGAFFVLGSLGRLLRFAGLLYFPQLVRALTP